MFVIFISVSFLRLSNKTYGANRLFSNILFFLGVFVPSIIGGLRNEDVGTDMNTYGIQFFELACSSHDFWKYITDTHTPELAYYSLNYFCSAITKDIHFFLFCCEFIKMISVAYVCRKWRDKYNAYIFVLPYMLLFYCSGFSMMRQSLAICFCIIAFMYFIEKKYTPYIFNVIVAYEFHSSAIFFIALSSLSLIRSTRKRLLICVLGSIVMFALWQIALPFLASTGLFKSGLAELYMDSGVTTDKSIILSSSVLILLSSIAFLYKNGEYIENKRSLVLCYAIITLSTAMMAANIEVAFRVCYYIFIFLIFYVPEMLKLTRSTIIRNVLSIFYISLFLLSFYLSASHGLAGALPYESEALNLKYE